MYELSDRENKFIIYWQEQRQKQHHRFYFFIKGLRNASYFISAIILSLTTGWYKRIPLITTGLMITFFVSCFVLALFISVFTAYYISEQNEQRFWELKNLINKQQET